MDIKLNFINQSNDVNDSDVVIFAKNVATSADELAIAWLVIQHCGQGEYHPFTYPQRVEVGASDSWGNFTPQTLAREGQAFAMTRNASGDVLSLAGDAASPHEIEVQNRLPEGSINAFIFRAGKRFASKTSLAPQEAAVFEFRPTLWIGVVSQVEEGEFMNSAVLSRMNTELSLLGIASADIVMTGGGAGPEAKPFSFSLQNIVMA